MKVNREREIEIGNLIGTVIVRPDTLPQRERDRAISDLLSDRREMLALLKDARETIVQATWHCDKSGQSDLNYMSKKIDKFLRESGAME